jgi:hypothetical protein
VSVAIAGKPEEIPGIVTKSFLDPKGPKHCKNFYRSGHRFFGDLRQIVLHTTGGIRGCGRIALDSAGSPLVASTERVNNFAIYYARKSCRDASAHLWAGERGTVLCTADLLDERTWHAGSCNPFSIGIEMTERSDGSVFSATIQTTVALVEWLCNRFDIPRVIPMRGGQHITSPFSSVTKFRGIVGHRNQTGKHDPGDAIFDALFTAGFTGKAP